MAQALERLARELGATAAALPWAELRYQHTHALRARLVEKHAASTVNQSLSALRGVLREAARLGLMSAEDSARATDLKPAKGSRIPPGRQLVTAELRALLGACDRETPAGARDAAIVAVLYGCGLRRAELVDLDVDDLDEVGGTLLVRGKGGKQRLAFVAPAATAIHVWLRARGAAPGPMFLPVDRVGRSRAHRLSDAAVRSILRRLASRSGVKAFTPHDLRRTFVSTLLERGVDISTVQQMAGHAQVTTTQRYDRRGDDAKRRAADLLDLD